MGHGFSPAKLLSGRRLGGAGSERPCLTSGLGGNDRRRNPCGRSGKGGRVGCGYLPPRRTVDLCGDIWPIVRIHPMWPQIREVYQRVAILYLTHGASRPLEQIDRRLVGGQEVSYHDDLVSNRQWCIRVFRGRLLRFFGHCSTNRVRRGLPCGFANTDVRAAATAAGDRLACRRNLRWWRADSPLYHANCWWRLYCLFRLRRWCR